MTNPTRVRGPVGSQVPSPRVPPGRPNPPVGPAVSSPPSGPQRWPAAARSVDPVYICTVVALVAVVQLWLIGLWGADPRAMTDLGLVSLLGWPTVAALAVLMASFFFALARRARDLVLGAHLVTFIVLVHGTPAVLFGTLRYSWAWKHLGIVDFILRHGRVDTTIDNLGVYHNWPGFFGASAVLADLAGPEHLLVISMWATVVFNLANLLALRFLFRSFGADRIRTWLALLFFFITTWVGQDYFSPQAFAYLLFLVVVATVLRYFRRNPLPGGVVVRVRRLAGPLVLVTVLMVAIASSHQITPMALFITLTVLWAGRQIRGWYLPVIALVTMAGWALTVARNYTLPNLRDQLAGLDNPVGNVEGTFGKSATITGGQHLVSLAGRAVIVVMVVVALIGIIRLARRKQLDVAALLLAGAPGIMVFLTAFDGELLFRVFLFAAPFLSYFAAAALTLERRGARVAGPWTAMVPALVLSALLIPGFLLAYYGKDQQNYFTPGEVAAGQWISDHSVPGTLLVRGNTNYPRDFRNYEYVRNVDISAEPDWQRILADPAGVLSEWLADPRDARSYILITRSQMISNDSLGPMPPGALQHVQDALAASPLFSVAYRNADAVVFVLAATR